MGMFIYIYRRVGSRYFIQDVSLQSSTSDQPIVISILKQECLILNKQN